MSGDVLNFEAIAVAALVAAAVVLLLGWPWRSPQPGRAGLGCLLGAAAGVAVGCLAYGPKSLCSLQSSQGRLLLVVLPLAVVVESLSLFWRRLFWLKWLL